MIGFGVFLIILGIIGRIFASVTHITDTTVKAILDLLKRNDVTLALAKQGQVMWNGKQRHQCDGYHGW